MTDKSNFGTLMISLIERAVFPELLSTIGMWLSHDNNRSINIQIGESTLEVSNLSIEQEKSLREWFTNQANANLKIESRLPGDSTTDAPPAYKVFLDRLDV